MFRPCFPSLEAVSACYAALSSAGNEAGIGAWQAGPSLPVPNFCTGVGKLRAGFQGLFETADQGVLFEWLSEQADCATGLRVDLDAQVRARGDHDDGHPGQTRPQQAPQIKSVHARHVNISYDAIA